MIDVLRAADVPTISARGKGCTIRILSPPEDVGRHEVYDLRFEASGVLDSQPHAPGTREHLIVIDGNVQVTSNDRTEDLNAGDTARYPADVPHRIEAENAAQAYLIVISG